MTVFKESELAHRYCVGQGIEIGGSAHNPFGLSTRNVDLSGSMETTFKLSEIEMCGEALPVDIVAPGDDLPLADDSQDFVISSHVLEHFHNPVKALLEWYRIVRPGGIIFMIVPHMERTFDKDRPRTDLAHLIDDFRHDARTPHPDAVQDHDHVWITRDILDLVEWMRDELEVAWDIEEHQDVDDKVGNGFTVVLRKRSSCA